MLFIYSGSKRKVDCDFEERDKNIAAGEPLPQATGEDIERKVSSQRSNSHYLESLICWFPYLLKITLSVILL